MGFASTLREIFSWEAHSASIYDLAFSPDCQRLATTSTDGTVAVWETKTGGPVFQALRGHTGAAMGVVFSPDGQRIATAGWDKTVRLWESSGSPPHPPGKKRKR
jgi:WD40 repeat protein